jgi:hypothetical protein
MRVLSVSYSAGSSSFCNVNNNGNTNNNSAGSAGGCAPDSVSHAKCRSLATDMADTEGESILRAGFIPPRIFALIRPGGRFLHGHLIALRCFHARDVTRHTMQTAGRVEFTPPKRGCRTRLF